VEDASLLMARVAARDVKAFELLYDAYHRLVYGVALRMLGDVGAAEDVTQAVFLKIWTAPQRFREGNFAGWIVRVARNRALDALRSPGARVTFELPETLPEDETIESTAFANLDAANVRAALAGLPSEQREPIEMGFFEGLTHDEMARKTGIPLGTIKTRIRAGLARLRVALNESVTA
jgi:RNA polymerase sigma-70 factor (ECF subfamily)